MIENNKKNISRTFSRGIRSHGEDSSDIHSSTLQAAKYFGKVRDIFILKCHLVDISNNEQAFRFKSMLEEWADIERVDINTGKGVARVISKRPIALTDLQPIAEQCGLKLVSVDNIAVAKSMPVSITAGEKKRFVQVKIDGMHCRSCEITIERKFRELPGVDKVEVNADSGLAHIVYSGEPPKAESLEDAVSGYGYHVRGFLNNSSKNNRTKEYGGEGVINNEKLSFWKLVGLFAIVLFIGSMVSRLGWLSSSVNIGTTTNFGAIFLIGLVAASSSCVAVSGGLLLSSSARFNERYKSASSMARFRPVLLFVVGRLLSYFVLGGVIGLVGVALSPSPLITGLITIVAAFYMFIMGMEMLHIAPIWMKSLLPRLPKWLSHRVVDAEEQAHPFVPFLLGAGTFFLPCGFTQALQLYALTTGSFWTSGIMLFAFALGTAPALLALGWASGSFKGKIGQWFFRFSGAVVIILGLWNMQNGLAIAGYPIKFSHLVAFGSLAGERSDGLDSNVLFDGKQQIVKMTVTNQGYSPDNFTLRQGVPTRWEIDANNLGGCLAVIQAPKLGIRERLTPGPNVIEFTPKEAGTFAFSCSMGMYWGEIKVVS